MHRDGSRGGNWRKCGMKAGPLCGHSNSGFCSLIKWPQKGALSLNLCVCVAPSDMEGLCQAYSGSQWIGRLLQSLRSPVRARFASLLVVGNLPQNTMSLTSGFWAPLHSSGRCSWGHSSPQSFLTLLHLLWKEKKKKKIAEELAAFPASSSYTESFECVCVFMPQQSKKKKKGLTWWCVFSRHGHGDGSSWKYGQEQ